MIQIGEYQTLEILRDTVPGLFLGDENGHDVLLPNKYKPKEYNIGDKIDVFVYLDFEERLVATNIRPYITLNTFAALKIIDNSRIGAFLDWGLEKDLFVPFKEQISQMRPGDYSLVYMYEDKSTGRLAATERIKRYLKNETLTVEEGDAVELIIANKTDLGLNAIINEKHLGLIYHDEIFRNLQLGEKLKGFIKKIREDNKIDISLQPMGYRNVIEPTSQFILDALKRHNGVLKLTDNSHPDDIKRILQMSKKTFKKTIGLLYKQKQIAIKEDGIYLLKY